jgi:hypothetical protein
MGGRNIFLVLKIKIIFKESGGDFDVMASLGDCSYTKNQRLVYCDANQF